VTGKRAAPKQRRGLGWPKRQAAPAAPARSDADPGHAAVPAEAPVLAHVGAPSDLPHPTGPALPFEPPPPAAPSGAVVPAGNPSVLPSGAVPLGSRTLARQERERRSQRTRVVLAALVALVLLVVAATYVSRHAGGKHHAAPVASIPSSVVLLQIVDAQGAEGIALLGDQHASAGAVVLVPPQLSVDAGGDGGATMQSAALLPGTAAADGLSDALGLRIDGTWTLTPAGLAALVDSIGGVDADVDVDVRQGDVIKITAGQQHLGGAAAAEFATYAVPGQPAQAQLARLDTVLEAVFAKLSAKPAGVSAQLAALGATSHSTMPLARLSQVLADLTALDASNSLVYQSLPVHELDTGGTPTYTVDSTGAEGALSALTGSSTGDAANPTAIRVLVRNGVGTPGLGETTRAKLAKAGDVYVPGGNLLPFDKDPTVVLISEDTPQQRAMGDQVAKALGLTDASLRVTGEGQSIADVVVVLGTDYRP